MICNNNYCTIFNNYNNILILLNFHTRKLNYHDMSSINNRLSPINNEWELMMVLNKQSKSDIEVWVFVNCVV